MADSTEDSIEGWYYPLKLSLEWCEGNGIGEVCQLYGMALDEDYDSVAPQSQAPPWKASCKPYRGLSKSSRT